MNRVLQHQPLTVPFEPSIYLLEVQTASFLLLVRRKHANLKRTDLDVAYAYSKWKRGLQLHHSRGNFWMLWVLTLCYAIWTRYCWHNHAPPYPTIQNSEKRASDISMVVRPNIEEVAETVVEAITECSECKQHHKQLCSCARLHCQFCD